MNFCRVLNSLVVTVKHTHMMLVQGGRSRISWKTSLMRETASSRLQLLPTARAQTVRRWTITCCSVRWCDMLRELTSVSNWLSHAELLRRSTTHSSINGSSNSSSSSSMRCCSIMLMYWVELVHQCVQLTLTRRAVTMLYRKNKKNPGLSVGTFVNKADIPGWQ